MLLKQPLDSAFGKISLLLPIYILSKSDSTTTMRQQKYYTELTGLPDEGSIKSAQ